MHHYQMTKTGEVVKCSECGRWYLASEGCPTCAKEASGEPEGMTFQRELVENWSKRLYAIAKEGEKWARTEHDERRYEEILGISGEIHARWCDTDANLIDIPMDSLEDWSSVLSDVAKEGLHYSDDSHDIRRYSGVLEVAEDLAQQVRSVSIEPQVVPEKEGSASDVLFVADREIAPALIGMIEKAEQRVLIATPWIWGIDEIVEKLTELKQERNITVKILVRRPEPGKEDQHKEMVRTLWKREFLVETEDFLHAKLILVDNKELYIGSANLVRTSMDRNLEAGICTSDPSAVSDALVYFEDKFETAFGKRI